MSGSRATTELQESLTGNFKDSMKPGKDVLGKDLDSTVRDSLDRSINKIKADKGSTVDKIRSKNNKTKSDIDKYTE
jgi:hypothetical protein